VTEITAAAAAGDSATLGGVAHTLKSAARSVGALRLGELCQRLETAARVGNLQACKNLTGSLSRTFSHTRELIQVAMNTIAVHGRSRFAKLSIHADSKVKIAPVHSDFSCDFGSRSLMGFAGRLLDCSRALWVQQLLRALPTTV
jgi:hypothetical protein